MLGSFCKFGFGSLTIQRGPLAMTLVPRNGDSMSVEQLLARLSDSQKAGITAGHLRLTQGEVKISAKASPNGQEASREYAKLEALSAEGMAILCGGKIEPQTPKPEDGKDERTAAQKESGACDFFNYGYDLTVRATERAQLESTLEGPEKAIKKAVDALVTNSGFEPEEARAIVIAQRQKKGLPV